MQELSKRGILKMSYIAHILLDKVDQREKIESRQDKMVLHFFLM